MRASNRLQLILAFAAAALLLGAADARAGGSQGDPIDEVPALREYVEDIPTAKGKKKTTPTAPSSSRPQSGGTIEPIEEPRTLPRSVEKQVAEEGGSLAPTLRKIATSPQYGATRRPPKRQREGVLRALDVEPRSTPPAALGAAVTAGFGGGNTRMTVLLVTLLVTTAAAAATAGYRNRRER